MLHVCLLGGHERAFSLMTCVMANGSLSQRGASALETLVSSGFGTEKRMLLILHCLLWSILSAN